jgi:hypothetical protein
MRRKGYGHQDGGRLKSRTEVGDLASLADFDESAVTAQVAINNTGSTLSSKKDLIASGTAPEK